MRRIFARSGCDRSQFSSHLALNNLKTKSFQKNIISKNKRVTESQSGRPTNRDAKFSPGAGLIDGDEKDAPAFLEAANSCKYHYGWFCPDRQVGACMIK